MAKKTLVRDQDKFMLRLPDGMRERIKAKAVRAGMSMNEAIVFVLEKHFPAPATLEERLDDLVDKVAALKHGNDLSEAVDDLIDEIDTSLRDIAIGRFTLNEKFSEMVRQRLYEWDLAATEDAIDPFDDANYDGRHQVLIKPDSSHPFGDKDDS